MDATPRPSISGLHRLHPLFCSSSLSPGLATYMYRGGVWQSASEIGIPGKRGQFYFLRYRLGDAEYTMGVAFGLTLVLRGMPLPCSGHSRYARDFNPGKAVTMFLTVKIAKASAVHGPVVVMSPYTFMSSTLLPRFLSCGSLFDSSLLGKYSSTNANLPVSPSPCTSTPKRQNVCTPADTAASCQDLLHCSRGDTEEKLPSHAQGRLVRVAKCVDVLPHVFRALSP